MEMKEFYLNGGLTAVGDDAEFEKKHPRKGGKFAKKGEGGGVPTKSEELKDDIKYAKKWIADAKAGKFAASKELIKRNEKYLDGLVRLNDFVDIHGTEVKSGADYSRRIEFLMQNRQHLEIDGVASVKADARIGKFGNFILYPSSRTGAAVNVSILCETLGLGVKKTDKGNIQVFMKDEPKKTEVDYSKMTDVELGKAHADAVNGKNAELAAKIEKEQNRRYAVECSKMTDENLEQAIKDNKSLVERYGNKPDNPYVKDLEIAEAEKEKRVKAEAKKNAKKNTKKSIIDEISEFVAKKTGVSVEECKKTIAKGIKNGNIYNYEDAVIAVKSAKK